MSAGVGPSRTLQPSFLEKAVWNVNGSAPNVEMCSILRFLQRKSDIEWLHFWLLHIFTLNPSCSPVNYSGRCSQMCIPCPHSLFLFWRRNPLPFKYKECSQVGSWVVHTRKASLLLLWCKMAANWDQDPCSMYCVIDIWEEERVRKTNYFYHMAKSFFLTNIKNN